MNAYLYFCSTQSAKENRFKELANEPHHDKGLQVDDTQASVGAEEVHHCRVKLFLLHVGIADDKCRKDSRQQRHCQHSHL